MRPEGTTARLPLLVLAACFLLQAAQTFIAVHVQWMSFVTYPALKLLMVLVPIVVWRVYQRSRREVAQRIGWKRPNGWIGVVTGVFLMVIILGAYYGKYRPEIDPQFLVDKLTELKILDHYWALALVVIFGNSLMEEYYWRGFLLSELRAWVGNAFAVVLICGIMFGLHHVFAIVTLADGPKVMVGALGTIGGGLVWSLMRVRGASLLDCYISHILADVAVMWVGYDLLVRAGEARAIF